MMSVVTACRLLRRLSAQRATANASRLRRLRAMALSEPKNRCTLTSETVKRAGAEGRQVGVAVNDTYARPTVTGGGRPGATVEDQQLSGRKTSQARFGSVSVATC
jgi:hypothetical protein